MKIQNTLFLIAALLVALAIGWMGGWATRPQDAPGVPQATDATAKPNILYYRNPMGLPDTSPVPKKDSMGMSYIPVYAGDEAPAAPGTVVISAEKVQRLGVRTEQVRKRNISPSITASATVQVDETRQYVIAPKFEGWVEHLYANQTGMSVRRGQALFTVYSPELRAAQEEFRVADAAAKTLQANDPKSAATMLRLRDASKSRLRNWDISGAQLTRLSENETSGNLVISSPADAVILDKPIVQGARFAPGETILKLADLSTVWVIADIPASSAQGITVGQRATFRSPTLPDQIFNGHVTFVQPVIATATRTLAVRIELPNADGILRPGLFGDATIVEDERNSVLMVPRSAVLDSGVRQLVFVQIREGRFEPRAVVIGKRSDGFVEIREGLSEGDRVVTAANFLIDAESNLQSALDGFGSHDDHAKGDAAQPSNETTPPAIQDSASPKSDSLTPSMPADPEHGTHDADSLHDPAKHSHQKNESHSEAH